MARAIEVPVVVKKGSLSRSIEGEALTATKRLGGSGSRAVQPLGRMLGKIRADADEFTKSIEASNARVIAFGASVAVINGISRAFRELVSTTIRVEKTLTDINVVLNTSQANLQKFGDGIFKVAKNTAQSFEVAAEAALEFSRQGLSTTETLRRVNDALILTRLTGLKAAASVKGLTAAVNGFGKAGLTTTQIINKLSAVDVKFAVGTDDLIDALSRAGAVAQDAGVSFDELVAMVTVAQQKTARGGAVIGNAFKTIYTRMQDPRALNALREVNIAVDDQAGAALGANRVLQNLAQTYDTLTRTQKASLDQFVAGKFQINILKAALGDLGDANGEYNRALQVSINATDQAIVKNKQLNKTSAALAAQTGVVVEQLVKKIGDISIGPGIKNLLTTVNSLVESMTKGLQGDSMGAKFAKGLLKGIGGVLTGPGLIVIGGVFIKLFKDLVVFGAKSLRNLLGLNNAAKQQALIQQGIGQLLAKNLAYEQAMAAASGNVAKQQAITNSYLAAEVGLRQKNAATMGVLAAGAMSGGFRVSGAGVMSAGRSRGPWLGGGKRGIPGFAPRGGAIPNFGIPLWGKGLSKTLYKPATKSVAGQIATARGRAVENLISDYVGYRAAGSISLKGQGPIGRGADITSGTFAGFDAKAGGFLRHSGGSPDKSFLRAAAQGARTMHPWEQMTLKAPGGALKSQGPPTRSGSGPGQLGGLKRIDYNQGFFNPSSKRYSTIGGQVARGVRPEGYTTITKTSPRGEPSVEAGIPGWLRRATGHKRSFHSAVQSPVSEQNLMEHFFTALGKRVTPKVVVGKSHFTGKQSSLDREIADKVYEKIMSRLPQLPANFSKMSAKQQVAAKKALNEKRLPLIHSAMSEAQALESVAMLTRGVPTMAPNFSPLSDAIAREKHQVGAIMGMSPSSVQTKTIQNATLRSPFNPQGFGVISPTVGQNTFSDAKRMHHGENLKTANLPNFAQEPLRFRILDALGIDTDAKAMGAGAAMGGVIAGLIVATEAHFSKIAKGFSDIKTKIGGFTAAKAVSGKPAVPGLRSKWESFGTKGSPAAGLPPGAEPVKPYSDRKPVPVSVVEKRAAVIKKEVTMAAEARTVEARKNLGARGYAEPIGPRPPTRMEKFAGTRFGRGATLGAKGGMAGLKGMAGPAMTAAFMYPMVEPFLPSGGTDDERYSMTGAQRLARSRRRRQYQGGIVGGMVGASLASGVIATQAMAAGAAIPPAGPWGIGAKLLAYGVGIAAGTGIGSAVTPTLFGGDADMTPEEFGRAGETFSMKAQNDQELINSFQRVYATYLSSAHGSPEETESIKQARKIISGIVDQKARKELTSLLSTGKKLGYGQPDKIVDPSGVSASGARVAFPGASSRAGLPAPMMENPLYGITTPKQALARVGDIGRGASGRGMAPARWAQISKIGFQQGSKGAPALRGKRLEDLRAAFTAMSEEEFKDVSDFFKGLPAVGTDDRFKGSVAERKRIQEFSGSTEGDIRKVAEGLMGGDEANVKTAKILKLLKDVDAERSKIGAATTPGRLPDYVGRDDYLKWLGDLKGQQRQRAIGRGMGGMGIEGAGDVALQRGRGGFTAALEERLGFTGLSVARRRRDVAVQGIRGQRGVDTENLRTGKMGQLAGLTADFGMQAGGVKTSKFLQLLLEQGTPEEMREFAQSVRGGPGAAQADMAKKLAKKYGMDSAEIVEMSLALKGKGGATLTQFDDFFTNIAQSADQVDAAAGAAEALQDQMLDLAGVMKKNGPLYVGIEAFQNELGSAFHSLSMNAKSGSEALNDFGLNIVAAVNRKMMSDLAESITEGLFSGFTSFKNKVRLGPLTDAPGNQKGGIIKAQNGMYISGNRTGDRNIALLEDGEYVLNREFVKAAGKENLDAMNFGMASRFQSGGLSSKGRGRFGGTPGRGKSYPHKFFDADPLSLYPEPKTPEEKFREEVEERRKALDPNYITPVPPMNPWSKPSTVSPEPVKIIDLLHDQNLRITGSHRGPKGGRRITMSEVGPEGGHPRRYVFEKKSSGLGKPQTWQEIGKTGSGIEIESINTGSDKTLGKYTANGRDLSSDYIAIKRWKSEFQMLEEKQRAAIEGDWDYVPEPFDRRQVKFQSGGFFSDTSKKDKEEAQKDLGIALNSSVYHGGQTGFWLANNPTARRLQGFLEERQQERWQKEWEKEQKKTAMLKGLASTAISFGLSYGAGKLFSGGGGGASGQEEMSMKELKTAYPGQSDATYHSIQDDMGWSGGMSTFARRNMSGEAWSSYDWGGAWRNEKPWFNQSKRRGGGRQSGGYIDNIPALLTGGEFVVGRNAVQHYGTGYLNQINRMQDGGLVGNTAFNQGGNASSAAPSAAPTTNHNNVGITVNFGADANPEVKTVQSGAQEDPKLFAGKIRAAVMDVINQEQRVGGRLRAQRKGRG